jgi:hypothetical protein
MIRSLKTWGLVLLVSATSVAGCRNAGQAPPLKELQRARSGALNVVLMSEADTLQRGKGAFVLEFRGADGQPVDVGTVSVTATMTMAGMSPMFGDTAVKPASTKGRYDVTSDLSMAGTWRINVEWNGPTGRGSASLPGTVL